MKILETSKNISANFQKKILKISWISQKALAISQALLITSGIVPRSAGSFLGTAENFSESIDYFRGIFRKFEISQKVLGAFRKFLEHPRKSKVLFIKFWNLPGSSVNFKRSFPNNFWNLSKKFWTFPKKCQKVSRKCWELHRKYRWCPWKHWKVLKKYCTLLWNFLEFSEKFFGISLQDISGNFQGSSECFEGSSLNFQRNSTHFQRYSRNFPTSSEILRKFSERPNSFLEQPSKFWELA